MKQTFAIGIGGAASNVPRTRDPFVVLEFRTPMSSEPVPRGQRTRSSRCSCCLTFAGAYAAGRTSRKKYSPGLPS